MGQLDSILNQVIENSNKYVVIGISSKINSLYTAVIKENFKAAKEVYEELKSQRIYDIVCLLEPKLSSVFSSKIKAYGPLFRNTFVDEFRALSSAQEKLYIEQLEVGNPSQLQAIKAIEQFLKRPWEPKKTINYKSSISAYQRPLFAHSG